MRIDISTLSSLIGCACSTRCQGRTFGKNCSLKASICQHGNPCVGKSSLCHEDVNGTATCECASSMCTECMILYTAGSLLDWLTHKQLVVNMFYDP